MIGPFADSKNMAFNISKNPIGAVDCYIDDLCTIYVNLDSNAERCAATVGLALDVTGRPLYLDDPLPLGALLSLKKLQGEGQQAELKVFLAWNLNSRSLTIALSQRTFENSWMPHMPQPKP
jgi:hypothetical protein